VISLVIGVIDAPEDGYIEGTAIVIASEWEVVVVVVVVVVVGGGGMKVFGCSYRVGGGGSLSFVTIHPCMQYRR